MSYNNRCYRKDYPMFGSSLHSRTLHCIPKLQKNSLKSTISQGRKSDKELESSHNQVEVMFLVLHSREVRLCEGCLYSSEFDVLVEERGLMFLGLGEVSWLLVVYNMSE